MSPSPSPARVERYANRQHAGRVLAEYLAPFAAPHDAVVLALPRGGVPVAFEVATMLRLPLDVLVVRKLGMPGDPEYALGAVASGGVTVMNEEARAHVRAAGAESAVETVMRRELDELARRERAYRGSRPLVPVAGRLVLLVDDGLATGVSMEAAVRAVRARNPLRVVAAAPVGSAAVCWRLRGVADDVVCPLTPRHFRAVGQWYDDFTQTTDDEVRALLGRVTSPAAQRA